jgi:DNA-binding NtrC family response regulator
VIERAVSFAEGDAIEVRDLPDHIAIVLRPIHEESTVREKGPSSQQTPGATPDVQGTFKDAKEAWVASFEKDYIEALLKRNGNNISHAAREAEIDRKYFRKLMKKYGITAHGDDGDD